MESLARECRVFILTKIVTILISLSRVRARKRGAHTCTHLHTFCKMLEYQQITVFRRSKNVAHILHSFAHKLHTKFSFAHKKSVLHTEYIICTQLNT